MASTVRLFLDQPLAPGQPLPLSEGQAQYLFAVMRLREGARVEVFNGRDGAWAAEVAEAGRRGGALRALGQVAPQRDPPDVWLVFAPLKKARTDFLVEKAVELGAARLVPVATERTGAGRIAAERLRAHAVEAAEQCGATHVPAVAPLVPLARLLEGWQPGRRLLWADEARAGATAAGAFAVPPPAALLVGPEGGFTPAERARLAAHPAAAPVSLGPRILRAETAALAALTLWQASAGDWR
jgi:16S rRNA (uracil1498-N3)-methyltransferase